jgi:serine kinase of HPr protein (carbohydrate metabolism regulator)
VAIANIHATCVVCADAGAAIGAPADAGVLLLGDSGSYKSDLALRLIIMGARLVSDDRCEILFDGERLRARPPQSIAGLMEIRGVGIVRLPFVSEARVALAVQASREYPERWPERRCFRPPPDVELPEQLSPPEIFVAAHEDSAPAKILAAVAAFEKGLFREKTGT